MTGAHTDHKLRACAAGDKGREAATELLIRAGLASADGPCILHDTGWGVYAVDYDRALHGRTGLTGTDFVLLALTAIAHAAGYHQPTRTIDNTELMPRIVHRRALITWDMDAD